LIAQRAQGFTNASGTAIALSEDNLDEIICRARSGSSAPDVGTPLRVEGTFTGLCIQTGKELTCDDAETDTRVDTTAIRALGIRSMVVTPIKEDNRVVGVLAVFAPSAHAFSNTHVAVLKTMADQISLFLQRERRAREQGVQPEPLRPAAPPVMTARPEAAPPLPPPVVVKPASPASAPVSSPAARAALPVVSKLEPIKTTVVADNIAKLRRKEKPPTPKPDARPEKLKTPAGDKKKSGASMILLGVAGVAVIGVAATFVYMKVHGHPPSVTAEAHPAMPSATYPQPAAPSPVAVSSVQLPVPVPPGAAATVRPPADNNVFETAKTTDRTSAKSGLERRAPEPETVALSTAPSRIATSAPDAGQEAAPNLTLGGTTGSGALSSLAKSTAGPTPSMITQSQLSPVQVLKKVDPVYPVIAKQRRLSGILVIQVQVGKDGKLSNFQLISGPPIFRDAAFEALNKWKFKPATLNGQYIDQNTQIHMHFSPQ